MKQKLMLVLAIGLTACAGAQLSQAEREIVFIERTQVSKSQAYQRALAYLAKNLGDSNHAIKVQDAQSGTIITQIQFECNELRHFADPTKYQALYNLEFSAKDQKIRLAFEALNYKSFNIVDGKVISTHDFRSKGQIEDTKPCAEKTRDAILSAINKSSDW